MHPSFLLPLLHSLCKAPAVLTYINFPDVILAGKQPLDKEETRYLLAQGYLTETNHDSFGAYLELSDKARKLLMAD